MSVSRIAKRYARPILEEAAKQNQLEQVRSDMEQFDQLCKTNRDLVNLLKSPIIAHLKKAGILKSLFEGKMNDLTLSAFDLIARKHREAFLPDVAREFLVMYNARMGYETATVTTTFPLDQDLRDIFISVVRDISGKDPILEEKVDPNLIGGYVLRLGDRQIDESVSGKLKNLRIKFLKEQ